MTSFSDFSFRNANYETINKLEISNNNLAKLKEYFQMNEDILCVFFFGSYGTPAQRNQSDLDIAIQLKYASHHKSWLIKTEIQKILVTDRIDIVILNNAHPEICFEAVSANRLFYEIEKDISWDYVLMYIRNYQEFTHKYKYFSEIAEQRRKELWQEA